MKNQNSATHTICLPVDTIPCCAVFLSEPGALHAGGAPQWLQLEAQSDDIEVSTKAIRGYQYWHSEQSSKCLKYLGVLSLDWNLVKFNIAEVIYQSWYSKLHFTTYILAGSVNNIHVASTLEKVSFSLSRSDKQCF